YKTLHGACIARNYHTGITQGSAAIKSVATKLVSERVHMSRLWRALCLALAVVALGVFVASCGAGGTSYRIVNAIAKYDYSGTGGFDITLNGATEFTSVMFTNINPPG